MKTAFFMFIVYPSPKFWKSGSKYLDPTNAAGRKNLEAPSNGTFSDKTPEILAPTASACRNVVSSGANRCEPSVQRLSFPVLLQQSLGCAFRAVLLALQRWGSEIETASLLTCEKKAYNKPKTVLKQPQNELNQNTFKYKTATLGKVVRSKLLHRLCHAIH
jgi:hypothetical protein